MRALITSPAGRLRDCAICCSSCLSSSLTTIAAALNGTLMRRSTFAKCYSDTGHYTWRWIFLMNLPVGIVAIFLVLTFVEDPPFLRRTSLEESRIDYIGFGLLAVGIAFLQIVLDKGQEEDWFGSNFIVTLT